MIKGNVSIKMTKIRIRLNKMKQNLMINICITLKKINYTNISMQTKELLTKIYLTNYLRKYMLVVLLIQTFKT